MRSEHRNDHRSIGMCFGYMGIPGMKFAPTFIDWPEKDSDGKLREDQFWAYYMEAMGSKIIFMFALTPHVSEEAYQVEHPGILPLK